MSKYPEYKGFCIGNDNKKLDCIYYDTYTNFFEDIYDKLNNNSNILCIPIDVDAKQGYGISFKRNSKKISLKSYNYIINNDKLKNYVWYIYQKHMFLIYIYNDNLTDNEFDIFFKTLKENDNVTNLIIYNSIVSFPICQDKNIIKDAVLDGSVDNNL